MTRFLPVLFVLIVLGAVGGMDYFLHGRKSLVLASMDVGQREGYLVSLQRRVSTLFAKEPEVRLAGFLPVAPEGWQRGPYRVADGKRLTGADMIDSMISISTTNDLLQKFAERRDPGTAIADSYRKGASMVAVRVSFTPAWRLKGFQAGIYSKLSDNIRASVGFSGNSFAVLHGVIFTLFNQTSIDTMTRKEAPVDYRRIHARIGRQWSIMIMTNAGDRDVMEVLSGIDVVGMNAAMEIPLDTVASQQPVIMGPKYDLMPYPDAADKLDNRRTDADRVGGVVATSTPDAETVAQSPAADAGLARPAEPAKPVLTPVKRLGNAVCVVRAGKRSCPKK